jgi:hypothetical protein
MITLYDKAKVKIKDKNVYAWMHYTCEYADWDNMISFLHKKAQRENDLMYAERRINADPSVHFATVVDEIAGMVFGNENEAVRQWQDLERFNVIGNENDTDSVAFNLMRNADGKGTGWGVFWQNVAIKLLVLKPCYVVVDGVTDEKEATVHTIFPWHVHNKKYNRYGKLIECWVEWAEGNYTRYTLEGWSRHEKIDGVAIDTGDYEYYETTARRERILPIYAVELPIERHVGFILARKNNVLFNLDSIRDFSVRNVTFNLLRFVGSKQEFQEQTQALQTGTNVILQESPTGTTDYISPDSGMIEAATNVFKEKLESFYRTAFKEYSDAARLQTATQLIQRKQSSLDTILLLLTDTLDDAENRAMWLISQIYNPNNPDVWGDSYVTRVKDFQSMDIEKTIDAVLNRYIDGKIPLDENGMNQVISQVLKLDSIYLAQEAVSEISRAIIERNQSALSGTARESASSIE